MREKVTVVVTVETEGGAVVVRRFIGQRRCSEQVAEVMIDLGFHEELSTCGICGHEKCTCKEEGYR